MSLQSQVYTSVATGIPGAKADMNGFDYYPQSLTAETDIAAGTFVWAGTNPEIEAAYGGVGAPIGFVERNIAYQSYDVSENGSLFIAKGETLTIATRGCFHAVTTTNASAGQSVFALASGGKIATAGAGETVSGGVETPWQVITSGEAGETIIIKRS